MVYAPVATRPPPPPLELEASEVASRHSDSGLAQPDSRRAVTSCAPRRVETPSPDGPADLATFWTCTGRPVRVPRDVALPVVLLPDRRNTRHGRTGRGAFASMHFPQWDFSHRHCARSGRKRSRSCSWRHTGPPGLGSQSWCSLWQPLPCRFLFGRIYCLRDGAPCGTRVQTSENFMSGPWTDAEVLGDLLQEGVYTITSVRTLSTRHAYALKLNLFVEWCSSHREDPGSARSESYCPFCSSGWSEGCLPPSLNAYGAMIAANHDPVDGKLVGKHDWVIRFLRRARRLNPPRPPSIPSWDLSLVLRALQQGQFEPCKQSSWSFSQNENSTPACTNLHQEGWGPACIFCRRFVPKVWTGGFPDNPEAPARLCAQGSHFSLRGPSGEPASAAPGGELRAGRPLTHSLDSIAFVWNRFPPVFSPQTDRSTEGLRFRVDLLKTAPESPTVDPVELLHPLGSWT